MFTCRDVTLRLRQELHDDTLLVRFDTGRERYVVLQRVRRVTGRRKHSFALADDATLVPGKTTLREVVTDYEPVYYHEAQDGSFLPLEPTLMRQEVLARDNFRGNVAKRVMGKVVENRAARAKQFEDDVGQMAKETRRVFARHADEMGV